MLDGKADAAGLRDHGDPAFGRNHVDMARLDVDRRAEGGRDLLHFAEEPLGVRTGNPHPRPLRQRGDGVLHGGAVAALLGKARRDDDGVLDAGGGALLERTEHRLGRNDDDGEIDRLPDVGDRGKAFQPVDIAVIGIDRINFSGKFVLAQHRQQPPRNLLQIARGADQRDAVGREEDVERVRHWGTSRRPSWPGGVAGHPRLQRS